MSVKNSQYKPLSLFILSSTIFCFLLLMQLGCPGEPPVEKEPDQSDASTEVKALGPLDQALEPNETRGGRIKAETELLKGIQAIGKKGDWKLYNKHVGFVIHGVLPTRSWGGQGGHIIDASPLNKKGQGLHDHLEEIFPIVDVIRVLKAQKIQLVEAGGKGKRTVVRVTGIDVGVPIIDTLFRTEKLSIDYEIDYILEPDAKFLKIITRLKQPESVGFLFGDGLLLGDQTRQLAQNVGLEVKKTVGKKTGWLGSIGKNVSYLFATADPKGTFEIPVTEAAVFPAYGKRILADQAPVEYERLFFVGDGRLENLLQQLRIQHKRKAKIKLKGKLEGRKQLEEINVFLLSQKGIVLSQTKPDSKGGFSFQVDEGSYQVKVEAPGVPNKKINFPEGATLTIKLPKFSILQVQITEIDTDGKRKSFVPARLELKSSNGNKHINLVKQATAIKLQPGQYQLLLCRGLAYEYVQKTIDLKPGETLKLKLDLIKKISFKGYIAGDMHLHAAPSIDSTLSLVSRVSSVVSEGLQFAVATDHDTRTDYAPTVKALGLQKWLKTSIGSEISPIKYHFNAFPVIADPNLRKYFVIPWAEYKDGQLKRILEAPEVWKKIRTIYKAKIIQINHPRRTSGYFSTVKYDRKSGIKGLKKGAFEKNWDSIELYGKPGRKLFMDELLFDWFSLLNQGVFKTAVGNSDSHAVGRWAGMPRTLIASSHQSGDKINEDEVIESIKSGKAQIYAGPYISIKTQAGSGPGLTIKSTYLELQIKVEAPSWITVSYVKVYGNGKLVKELKVPASKDVVRFQKMLQFKPKKDTWYVVVAGDEAKTMAPVYPGRLPVSMTNPVYLDLKGDGFQALNKP